MANILEFLRGVITEPEEQKAFRSDPGAYVDDAGFVDLTGEDVVEAVLVLRRSLPDHVAASLAAFEDDDELPSARPGPKETELDAAVRILHFAIARSGTAAAPAPAADDDEAAADEAMVDEPIDVENELDTDLAEEAPEDAEDEEAPAASTAPQVAREPAADSSVALQRFSEILDAFVADSKASFAGAVDESTVSLTAIVEDSTTSLSDVVEQARAALAGVVVDARASLGALVAAAATALDEAADAARDAVAEAVAEADADILQLRAGGEAEREEARRDAERIRTTADNELQRAREQAEETRQRADELAAAADADIDARRAEMREVERQLKDRLSGIDSLFRTALGGEEGAPPPA